MRRDDWRAVTSAAALGVVLAVIVSIVTVLLVTPRTDTPVAPSPLPAGQGVEPQGATGDTDTVPVPDAGQGAVGSVRPPDSDGYGDMVYVKTPALYHGKQEVRLNAGWAYSNGVLHKAWDLGVWRGTPAYAAADALVVGSNNGVPNDLGGSASNWVLLCRDVPGIGPSLLYYQHLSPGFIRGRGAVRAGALLGYTGNSGHSTGDHLHLAAGKSPQRCATITASDAWDLRYRYLNVENAELFAPSKWWALPAVSWRRIARACRSNGYAPGVAPLRAALGLPASRGCGPRVRARIKVVQKRHGWAVTGIPTRAQLRVIGRNRFEVR